ncbi:MULTISPECIES: DNA (cytosine-5-)-methyltransferase [Salinivibrio]|uniref:DNA (cytosine-5-)-methyltransferase n=1 Tax=Salinivibrio TaxID=51366 RepID=UPI00084C5E65|nr:MULTISPECIES: DNA (cytosine-5-)-methyltransferase [Salinivibrio]ODP99889.1 DNA (cytosine-5-)-methyltransferase [Salinivibrio sp. DV]OOF27171.1 DNA (cytosine-5-)-methyltransferase [Salinivibrio proteolyticus]
MLKKEYVLGDQADEQRILEQQKASDALLKLLVEIYDQKNLSQKLNCEETGLQTGIFREKLNRWHKDPQANPILIEPQTLDKIREALLPPKPAHWDNPEFTFIDLFAGIGGLRKGFEDIGGKCVFTSEWDKNARRTYLANHYVDEKELPYFINNEQENPHRHTGMMDITKVTLSGEPEALPQDIQRSIDFHIPDHDVLLAGFPCQPFSLAGVSKKNSLGRAHGFQCDTQGTLFFDVERILHYKKPKFFVLENVKNLKSHDKGNTFATIVRALDSQGYHLLNISDQGRNIEEAIRTVRQRRQDPTIIDGAHFTPQHRERIVLVGIRRDLIAQYPSIKSLDMNDIPVPKKHYTVQEILCVLSDQEKKRYTLTENLWNYLYHYALKHQSKGNGFGFGLVDPRDPQAITRTLSARYYKDGSEILINQDGLSVDYLANKRQYAIAKNMEREQFAQAYALQQAEQKANYREHEFKAWIKEAEQSYDEQYGRYAPEFDASYKTPRRLTPKECARLMGFEKPEYDRSPTDRDFNIVCADTSAYKQFGNSVVVPVFRAVAKLMAPAIQTACQRDKSEKVA